MKELSIKEIFSILRRRLALLILIPLVVTSVVGGYYFFYSKNQYTAEAKLYVLIDYEDSSGGMRYDVNTSTLFAGDYQQLIKTHEVLSVAAKKLGVEDLKGLTIDVTSQENTRVICLSVTGGDPIFSMNAANMISEVFIEYLATITQTNSVSIASKALQPNIPSGPNRIFNTAKALIFSIIVVAGLLIAIAMMNTTLRTSEEVENSLHIPVLGRIAGYKKEMNKYLSQKGTRKPLYYSVSRDTREGIKTLSMNLQFVSGRNAVKTLAITSATPNEGKSSISIMLATALAEEGKQVLLCDMDFRNPSVGNYLGVRNRLDIVDVLQGTANIENIITATHMKGLYFVDSYHKRLQISNVVQSSQYREFIRAVNEQFDIIVFDTPPIGLFIDSAVLTNIADKTLLVIASGRVERALGKEIVDQLQKANASIIGVALNFVDYKNNHYSHYYRHYYKNRYDRSYDDDSDIPDQLHA